MKFCLAIGLHHSYFDIAIIDSNHEIVEKRVCKYNKNMDVSNSIYSYYKLYFGNYKIAYVGVGVSNNIEFKDDIVYNLQGASRYNITKSLYKLFKKDVYVLDETMLAGLAMAYKLNSKSLIYLIVDNKVSNSFIFDKNVVVLDDDIDIRKGKNIDKCNKSAFKKECLKKDLDDEFVGIYFFSNNEIAKGIVNSWCKNLSEEIKRVTSTLKVNDIVFAGYLGQYYEDFRKYLKLPKNVNCVSTKDNRENTLLGISHLIYKDN